MRVSAAHLGIPCGFATEHSACRKFTRQVCEKNKTPSYTVKNVSLIDFASQLGTALGAASSWSQLDHPPHPLESRGLHRQQPHRSPVPQAFRSRAPEGKSGPGWGRAREKTVVGSHNNVRSCEEKTREVLLVDSFKRDTVGNDPVLEAGMHGA